MNKKSVIVPHDFTEVADAALKHAIITAAAIDAEVHVLHVVEKRSEISKAEKKLQELIEKTENKNNVEIVQHTRIGNIFDDIGDFASETGAELIIMGTHGAHGWQHITGSHALKVVTSSEVPFIIVQNGDISDNGYDDIVVPLDLHKETKQKLTIVANMAKYFKSRVHVIIPDETDEFLLTTVKANIIFANKFFAERGIEVTTQIADSKDFDSEVIRLADKANADLIAIMNLQKNQMFGSITGKHEQVMITNSAKVPVLIVNPVTKSNSVQFYFAG
ncbi:MAG: universal stress protein [Crocinitomicaceae bacterium]